MERLEKHRRIRQEQGFFGGTNLRRPLGGILSADKLLHLGSILDRQALV